MTVFLYIHGVKLMKPGGETLVFHEENPPRLLKDVMADGCNVRVCPHCMMEHKVEAEGHRDGIQVMDNDLLIEKIRKNPTVFTY